MGMSLHDHLEQQKEELLVRQQNATVAKSITHGHINKLNKLKSQVSTAGRKVQQPDKEWEAFVDATIQKIRQHAQLFQQCRADLMEAYNNELGELTALKQEMCTGFGVGRVDDAHQLARSPKFGRADEGSQCSFQPGRDGWDGGPDIRHWTTSKRRAMLPCSQGRDHQSCPSHSASPTKVAQQHLEPRTQDL